MLDLRLPLFMIMMVLVVGCTNSNDDKTEPITGISINHFDTLRTWMTGSFSSELQAENDSDYYNICLEMHPIWMPAEKEQWMYVEQSLASMTDRPYRQRVYHLFQQGDSSFVSEVYELSTPEAFTGQWLNKDFWSDFTPDSITKKDGCAVYLNLLENGVFQGSTDSASCLSTLRGASFANSIVTVDREGITSWDQGFDSVGVQVWGAEKGGYEFLRNRE